MPSPVGSAWGTIPHLCRFASSARRLASSRSTFIDICRTSDRLSLVAAEPDNLVIVALREIRREQADQRTLLLGSLIRGGGSNAAWASCEMIPSL